MLRTLAPLAYEHYLLCEAEQLLERCLDVVHTGRPVMLLLTHLELARVWNARGDHDTAFGELDRAHTAVPRDVRSPVTDRVDAYRARLLTEHGDIASTPTTPKRSSTHSPPRAPTCVRHSSTPSSTHAARSNVAKLISRQRWQSS